MQITSSADAAKLVERLFRRANASDDECRTDDADLFRESADLLAAQASQIEALTKELGDAYLDLDDANNRATAWIRNEYGAFCPCCGEHVPDGSEDYDWGCGCCGFPDQQAVADYRAGYDGAYYPDHPPIVSERKGDG